MSEHTTGFDAVMGATRGLAGGRALTADEQSWVLPSIEALEAEPNWENFTVALAQMKHETKRGGLYDELLALIEDFPLDKADDGQLLDSLLSNKASDLTNNILAEFSERTRVSVFNALLSHKNTTGKYYSPLSSLIAKHPECMTSSKALFREHIAKALQDGWNNDFSQTNHYKRVLVANKRACFDSILVWLDESDRDPLMEICMSSESERELEGALSVCPLPRIIDTLTRKQLLSAFEHMLGFSGSPTPGITPITLQVSQSSHAVSFASKILPPYISKVITTQD